MLRHCCRGLICTFLVLTHSASSALFPHVQDFPGAPPLNSTAAEYEQFRARLLNAFHDALASTDWQPLPTVDGVSVYHRKDPKSGCPWLKAEAELMNCSLQDSAKFIITNLTIYEHQWDSTLVSNYRVRNLFLANGSHSITWHREKDSAFLEERAYYLYDGWRWNSDTVIEDAATSVHSEEAPPPGHDSRSIRSAQWAWKRLTGVGMESTHYEVAWLSDVKGLVPCTIDVDGSAKTIRKEVQTFRKLIPQMHTHPPIP